MTLRKKISSRNLPKQDTPPIQGADISRVLSELQSLRIAVEGINSPHALASSTTLSDKRLGVFITKTEGQRKPYLVQCEGIISNSFRLSPIRAAILLVLLLDLEDRLEGGSGVDEPLISIEKTVRLLDGDSVNQEDLSIERVRVAIYRFWEFCETSQFFDGKEMRIDFDDAQLQFNIKNLTNAAPSASCTIEITSNDVQINSILSSTLTRSPLGQVRKRKALFVTPGPEGADRLLLEMYDHRFPLRVTSLYVRPPLPSYPDALLAKLGVSQKVLKRKELAFEGYRTGRFEFFEILNEATIWDLIRYVPREGFKLYPRKVSKADVQNHIENLISILKNYENYHLYITKMVIPFVVVTYEIRSQSVPEYITIFFQAFSSAAERDLGCFAMYDRAVYQNITDHIVQWLLDHPSTIKNRSSVISLLQRVLSHLEQHGPLTLDAPIPE
jgi:hypothetical protein